MYRLNGEWVDRLIIGIIIITLLVFLAAKELASISGSEFALRLSRFLTVPIISLLILFVLMVVLRMTEILA